MNRRRRPTQAGFTLLEMMVVIAIIAILSTVAATGLRTMSRRARENRRKADIESLQKALRLYYIDNGSYPLSSSVETVAPNSYWLVSNDSSWNTLAQSLKPYLPTLPMDPLRNLKGQWAGTDYGYAYYAMASDPICFGESYVIVYRPETSQFSPGAYVCGDAYLNYFGTVTLGSGVP